MDYIGLKYFIKFKFEKLENIILATFRYLFCRLFSLIQILRTFVFSKIARDGFKLYCMVV